MVPSSETKNKDMMNKMSSFYSSLTLFPYFKQWTAQYVGWHRCRRTTVLLQRIGSWCEQPWLLVEMGGVDLERSNPCGDNNPVLGDWIYHRCRVELKGAGGVLCCGIRCEGRWWDGREEDLGGPWCLGMLWCLGGPLNLGPLNLGMRS